MQKSKKNITGYIVMGTILLLTIITFVVLKINNNKQSTDDSSGSETESRAGKLASWEKYLYADIENPTYCDVIYEGSYDISFEGFEKYQVGKLGDTVTFVEAFMPLGGDKQEPKVIKENITVLSVNIYDNEEQLEASVGEGEKLYKIKGEDDLYDGCKYVVVEIKISSMLAKAHALRARGWIMYLATPEYTAQENVNVGYGSTNDDFASSRYIYKDDIVFCKTIGENGFNFIPIDKEKEQYSITSFLIQPANGSLTFKQVFPVPEQYIDSDNLVFATQLNGDGGTYRSNQFCIFVNR